VALFGSLVDGRARRSPSCESSGPRRAK